MASSRLERIGTIFTRQTINEKILKCLSDIMTQLDKDCSLMKENEQKLENLMGVVMKFIQQSTSAHTQKFKALKELHDSFKKQVEGLVTRGAMKPDDRPLWFDVYKAFPPIAEPKFSKPKPDIKPIRQILYKEDAIRAKFHTNGHGLGAVNLLGQSADTQTKRLVQQYEKLNSEGISENELIEKSAEIVSSERQSEVQKIPKNIVKNPGSVTAQVLTDADLNNIFKA